MRKTILTCAAALLLAAAAVPAVADDDRTVRTLGKKFAAGSLSGLVLDVPVGEVTLEVWAEDAVDVVARLRCDRDSRRCEQAAQKVRLIAGSRDGKLRLRFEDWPKARSRNLHALVEVRVPRALAVDVDLGVGELNVDGLEGDLRADLGVGEVNVAMPEAAVQSVTLDTGIGEASLHTRQRTYERAGLIARRIRWREGSGKSVVEVDCGVGEIDVTLR